MCLNLIMYWFPNWFMNSIVQCRPLSWCLFAHLQFNLIQSVETWQQFSLQYLSIKTSLMPESDITFVCISLCCWSPRDTIVKRVGKVSMFADLSNYMVNCWENQMECSVLTCPKGSRWLFVSLSFWNDISCLIQWVPVAGESGCT